MKRITAIGLGAVLTGMTALAAVPATAQETAAAPSGSAHCSAEPLTMAYYRTWRDETFVETNPALPKSVGRMSDLPPEIDVAMVFEGYTPPEADFWPALRDEYVPKLHAQGTRAVYTLWIEQLATADIPLTEDAYRAYARHLVDTYVTPFGLDGIDIDVESYPRGDGLTRAIGVFNALGEIIGPRSGTDKLFIYDTNQNGDTALFEAVSPNISFVLLQAYGRKVEAMQSTWETFADDIASCQFLPGFSFPEERDTTHWGDAEGLYDPATAERFLASQYATWQPEGGTKGGFFAYAVDRDGKTWGDDTITATAFTWMKNLTAVQDDIAGVAPKPTSAALAPDRVTLTGVGAPGATVSISVAGPGRLPAGESATAAVDGSWTITLDRKLTAPQTVSVTQRLPHTPSSTPVEVRFEPWAG